MPKLKRAEKARLTRAAQKFLGDYAQEYPSAYTAAEIARSLVEQSVRETGALTHITARAKTLSSLRGKLRRKPYKRPRAKLTDLVGVRVITFYKDAVDPIVEKLRQSFEINQRETTDKRKALGLRDFGYRSVHLIARLRPQQILSPQHAFLHRYWFEIQVRSILEHAWAEIEHEIVYKAGVKQPDEIYRRFASLAGTLELLDGEFLALRNENSSLIERYRKNYVANKDLKTIFDVARLLGFLEANLTGLSWREAAANGKPFAAGLDGCCVDALKAVGLGTPFSLLRMFRSGRFRYALRTFSAAEGLAPAEVSHLACVVLAVILKDPRVVEHHFPEIITDPVIKQFYERRTKISVAA